MHPERIDVSGLTVLPDRFAAKISKAEDGCWNWTANKSRGYGRFKWQGRTLVAHRFAYCVLVGPIPDDLQLDHLCRNRACVNPAHLEPVTAWENTMRGQTPAAQNAAKTHCPRGHAFTDENTLLCAGKRRCRTCERIASRKSMRLIRAKRLAAGLTTNGTVPK